MDLAQSVAVSLEEFIEVEQEPAGLDVPPVGLKLNGLQL